MELSLEIIYLEHSGFVVKVADNLLLFDYYKDPAGAFLPLIQDSSKLWVFCSHKHDDHFNRIIAQWQGQVSAYILSSDIEEVGGLTGVSQEKIIYMSPYTTREQGPIKVTTYGSTDEGVSFLVEVAGWRVFHAGDLNWWHWKGDTPANIKLAEEDFQREMDKIAGVKLDVAFFPVDSRLEECRDMGIREFCRRVDSQQLVVMHTCGQMWTPPADFPEKAAAVWCPTYPGERIEIKKG